MEKTHKKTEVNPKKPSCWLCLRITPEKIFALSHQCFEDDQDAYIIAKQSCLIISESYKRNPIIFCGRRTKTTLSGLFYLIGKKAYNNMTQRHLAETLDISEVGVRESYKRWLIFFRELIMTSKEIREIEARESNSGFLKALKTLGLPRFNS